MTRYAMKSWASSVFFSLALISGGSDAHAQDQPARPVTSAYTIGIGSSHLCDTYLTPLHYDGWHAALGYERFQAMAFEPERWIMRLDVSLNVDRAQNPARNATMWNLGLHAGWGMMRRWHLPAGVTVAAGGSTSIEGGALYLSRNGNNPVSAKGAWTLNITGMATWATTIGRLPVTLRYQPELPVVGAFFSPQYGELYYEIYLGDRKGLAHCAWWGNRFVMDNLVTADLRLGATALRLGYSCRIMSSKVNHIVTRETTHSFVIGISGEWMSLSPRHAPSRDTRIISAFY